MKKSITIALPIILIVVMFEPARGNDMECRKVATWYVPPALNEVHIGPVCIGMPLNKILIVRKEGRYSVVKFTKYWTEKDGKEKYATYEVQHQQNGTGDFSNRNVKWATGKASFLPPRGLFYPLIWQPGYPFVKCGNLKLAWDPLCDVNHVCFVEGADPPGDYGIELAPTPWTDIKEVNVFDPRVKWYKYDELRKRVNIPIDKLWGDTEKKKEK